MRSFTYITFLSMFLVSYSFANSDTDASELELSMEFLDAYGKVDAKRRNQLLVEFGLDVKVFSMKGRSGTLGDGLYAVQSEDSRLVSIAGIAGEFAMPITVESAFVCRFSSDSIGIFVGEGFSAGILNSCEDLVLLVYADNLVYFWNINSGGKGYYNVLGKAHS